jgi:NitT/TauT family transport system substrate-binding protein
MYLLHENGLSIRDVQIKDMSTQNASAAFVGGAVDAAGLYEPYLTTSTKRRQGSRVVVSSAQLPGLIVDLMFASESAIQKRSSDIRAVIDGWNKAIAFIGTNHDDAFTIMAKAFNLPVSEFTDIVGGIRWLHTNDNTALFGGAKGDSPLAKTMQTVVGVLQRHYPQTYGTAPSSVIDSSFVSQVGSASNASTTTPPVETVRYVHP